MSLKMTSKSKRAIHSNYAEEENEEMIPLSPITSPDPKPLTKRQEQNRAAQRAFRERRAQTLKEMEARLVRLERIFDDFSKTIARIGSIENDLVKLKENVNNLYMTVDSLTVPTWTVPVSDDLKSIVQQTEPQPIGIVLGALRPSSTDPTLTSPNQ